MKSENRVPTDGGRALAQNPFGALSGAGLPSFAKAAEGKPAANPTPSGASGAPPGALSGQRAHNRGRVDIVRSTAGRGGRTVTVVSGFVGIGQPEKEQFAKKMRAACGAGGTVKDGCIEIQGDKREQVAKILTDAGFRPVFAGG
jgi:translation initiation factor 1